MTTDRLRIESGKTDIRPLLAHPFDWAKPAAHVSGLPEGTEVDVWRDGKHQIARLHRIVPNGEQWNIYTEPRYAGAEPGYLYSVGWRYIVEHTL